jgi:hypothetical protein
LVYRDHQPPFLYTIGLMQTQNHPEFIMLAGGSVGFEIKVQRARRVNLVDILLMPHAYNHLTWRK